MLKPELKSQMQLFQGALGIFSCMSEDSSQKAGSGRTPFVSDEQNSAADT